MPKSGTLVVGVSGGADSMSLLLAMHELVEMKKLDLRLVAAHYNHRLRDGESDAEHNAVHKRFKEFRQVRPGSLTPKEYDEFVRDTVNFLDYIGEPMQLERRSIGLRVLTFLLVFFLFAYFLKKEYWKDVK